MVITIVTGVYKPTYNWGGTTLYVYSCYRCTMDFHIVDISIVQWLDFSEGKIDTGNLPERFSTEDLTGQLKYVTWVDGIL